MSLDQECKSLDTRLRERSESEITQAAIVAFPDAQTRTRGLRQRSMNHPTRSQPIDRAVTVSDVSSIPPSDDHFANTMEEPGTDDTQQSGSIVRNQSTRSSICRSPGWESARNRRKNLQEAKDRRKQERSSALVEVNETRQRSRLKKDPPVARGSAKLSTSMPRSDSSSTLQVATAVLSTGSETLGLASERASNDTVIKAFTKKSANRKSMLPSSKEDVRPPTERGFLGGMKLQRTTQNQTQEALLGEKSAIVVHKSNFVEEFPSDEIETLGQSRMGETSSSYTTAVKSEGIKPNSEIVEPSADEYLSRGRKGRISNVKNPTQLSTASQPDLSDVTHRESRYSSQKTSTAQRRGSEKPVSASFSDRPPNSYREPPQLANIERRSRRNSLNSLFRRRSQSKERPGDSGDESGLSAATSIVSTGRQKRDRSWSFSKSSRTSMSRPTTAGSFESTFSQSEGLGRTSFSHGLRSPPRTSGSSRESVSQASKFSISNNLQDFKTAAKATFSRRQSVSKSSSVSNDTPREAGPNPVRVTAPIEARPSVTRSSSEADNAHATAPDSQVRQDDSKPTTNQASKLLNLDSGGECHSLLSDGAMKIISSPGCQPETAASQTVEGKVKTGNPRPFRSTSSRKMTANVPCVESSNSKYTDPVPNNATSSTVQPAQDFGFLPPLRHRTLKRPNKDKNKGSTRDKNPQAKGKDSPATNRNSQMPTPLRNPSASSPTSLSRTKSESARHLQSQRQSLQPSASTSQVSVANTNSTETNTRAKMFVICCSCRYYHDMPSKVYECMAKPDNVVRDPDLGVSGVISTRVKCPWCSHGMSTTCCEGWAAVLVLKERLH